jgi:hypothetical protein
MFAARTNGFLHEDHKDHKDHEEVKQERQELRSNYVPKARCSPDLTFLLFGFVFVIFVTFVIFVERP